MKPMILLTTGFGRVREMEQRQLFQNYGDAICQAGGQPVLALGADPELAERMDGLFLTGGVDIDPCQYGMERAVWCGQADAARDQEELFLFQLFLKQKKPVLGVCRGLQLINTALGGTLWQDQEEELGVEGHQNGVVHEIRTEEDCVIRSLFGSRLLVNSFHHQSVRTLGEGLKATARAGRIVEGVEHVKYPILAVQWHPERMTGESRITKQGPDMRPLFWWFVSTCSSGI